MGSRWNVTGVSFASFIGCLAIRPVGRRSIGRASSPLPYLDFFLLVVILSLFFLRFIVTRRCCRVVVFAVFRRRWCAEIVAVEMTPTLLSSIRTSAACGVIRLGPCHRSRHLDVTASDFVV